MAWVSDLPGGKDELQATVRMLSSHPCVCFYGYRAEDSPLARPVDPSIVEIAYKVVSQTYKKRVYNAVLYDTADGSTVYEFVSEYIGGRWIFTEFPFIW